MTDTKIRVRNVASHRNCAITKTRAYDARKDNGTPYNAKRKENQVKKDGGIVLARFAGRAKWNRAGGE